MNNQNPERVAKIVAQAFEKIFQESMRNMPLLNSRIKVQTLGFQYFHDRIIGIVITPWLMNIILLPAEDEDWSSLALGHKQTHTFPSKARKFLVNDIDGIGFCQTHSLFSPMNEFSSHEHAVSAAQRFLDSLMIDSAATEEDLVDEELLGRILRGEETPAVNLEDFATIEPHDSSIPIKLVSDETHKLKNKLDRRSLLRGKFLEGA